MGSIGDFMRFAELAFERFEKNGGTVIVQESARATRQQAAGVKVQGERKTMVQRITAILKREGDVPSHVIRDRLHCSSGAIAYARGKLRGAAWSRPGQLCPPGVRKGPRFISAKLAAKNV